MQLQIQQGWGGAGELVFLKGSQVMLKPLLVPGPQLAAGSQGLFPPLCSGSNELTEHWPSAVGFFSPPGQAVVGRKEQGQFPHIPSFRVGIQYVSRFPGLSSFARLPLCNSLVITAGDLFLESRPQSCRFGKA